MHIYIHACMHACMHAYIHTYIHVSGFGASNVVCTFGTGRSICFIWGDMRLFLDLQGLRWNGTTRVNIILQPDTRSDNSYTVSALKEIVLSSESKATWRVESSTLHGQKFDRLPIHRCIFSLPLSHAAFRNPVSQ